MPSRRNTIYAIVSRLVRIDSTLGPAQPGQPFGPGPAAALEAFLSLAQEWGLPGENLSGYVGTVDLNNQPDTALHILGHLDIVDAGEGWTVTAPFQPKVVDGLLYGRGTADDKGPMVAALLAMKARPGPEAPPDQKRPPHRRHRRGDRFPGHQVVLRQPPLCPPHPVP